MGWIDDELAYPWSNPVARDLHRRLVDTFYEPSEVRRLVRAAKQPDVSRIAFDGRSIFQIWVDSLDRAVSEGALRTLLTYLLAEASVPRGLDGFVSALLADQSPPVAASAGGGTSGPAGPAGPAVRPVTRPEALLYVDDLSESVGEISDLVRSIERVMQWRGSVCHLRVLASNGSTYVGTGALVADRRILTNHHVIFADGKPPAKVDVAFDFEHDAKGQMLASTVVPGNLAAIRFSEPDDWATIELTAAPPASAVALDLAVNIATPLAAERAFILQHPADKPKRLAFVRNRISAVEARHVYYLTDTEGGSSGAPVFNGQGQMIALHRAGGYPQTYPGVPPTVHNEGIRIDVIAPEILKPGS